MEKIKCAALRLGNKIYVGKYHGEIFPQEPIGVLRHAEHGFVTDSGMFVSREKAAEIAFKCGQITIQKKELFSEDIY